MNPIPDLSDYEGYLLDTNTCIAYLNTRDKAEQKWSLAQKRVIEKMKSVGGNFALCMSEATFGELLFGAEKSQNREKNLKKILLLESIVEKLLVDEEVWKLFAKIKATLQKKGKTMSNMDILIAATAKSYNLILVSNDKNMKNLDSLEGELFIQRENWIQEPSKDS
jgi:predicted nucleic acid-binding protein